MLLHAAAAFIASLSSPGFGSADSIHLQQAVLAFNSQVSLPNAISVHSTLPYYPTSSWSSCCDLQAWGPLSHTTLDPLGHHAVTCRHGGHSPILPLDPLGHHAAVTCRHGGDVVIRHNRLWDEIFDLCRHAHLSASVERGHGPTRDLDHTRPADILIAGWDIGKPAALDITITSPLYPAILGESCHQAGEATLAAEACKLHSNGPKCQELGWSCIPLAVVWKLGQRGPWYHFKAGISPGHSPVFSQVIGGG